MKQNIWYSIRRLIAAWNAANKYSGNEDKYQELISLAVEEEQRIEYVFSKDCTHDEHCHILHFLPETLSSFQPDKVWYTGMETSKPSAERFKNLIKA